MVKSVKKIPWSNIGLVFAAAFAWSKLGVGAAAKDVGFFRREYPPQTETGYLTQAEWQLRYGGSQLDYEDWLRGQ